MLPFLTLDLRGQRISRYPATLPTNKLKFLKRKYDLEDKLITIPARIFGYLSI